jgi:7-carboxy-7-deazaguanine synthase
MENVIYDVSETFYSIQGEGPDVGTPAFFIRLAGCNLRCPFCDTDHSKKTTADVESLAADAQKYVGQGSGFVVISGGEPFTQNIVPLIERLVGGNLRVQIETNGTLWLQDMVKFDNMPRRVSIICSPKNGRVHTTIAARAVAWKYIFNQLAYQSQTTAELATMPHPFVFLLPKRILPRQVFIQPEYGMYYEINVKGALDFCLQEGYRLSLQIHRILKIR